MSDNDFYDKLRTKTIRIERQTLIDVFTDLKEKSADEYKPGLEVAIDFINELIEGQQ